MAVQEETRTERKTLALLPSELKDALLVAGYRELDVSVLLREESMAKIREEAKQIRGIRLVASHEG